LIVLLYFSMGHMMWGWPLPKWFDGNHVAMGLVQLLLCTAVMVINQKFFVSGFKSLAHGAPNMDTLVALGASASYAWSVYALFAMTAAQAAGNEAGVMAYMDEFYFESAAMILALITVGKMLEAKSKGRTTDALKSLINLAPRTAVVVKNGDETEIPVEQVRGGTFSSCVRARASRLTVRCWRGRAPSTKPPSQERAFPADKAPGDQVSAATINQSGFLRCRATRVGQDTTLSQIIRMVSDAAATKAPIAKDGGQSVGSFCARGYGHCGGDHAGVAFCGTDLCLRAGQGHIGAGYQLPLRAGAGHTGGHHGGQRNGRQKRHPVQDGGLAGKYGQSR
jgi:Cu2+-exporting ATPase